MWIRNVDFEGVRKVYHLALVSLSICGTLPWLTTSSVGRHTHFLFERHKFDERLDTIEPLNKPPEVCAVWYDIGVIICVAEPFNVARNPNLQGHHLIMPVEQPFSDSMSQSRGSFSAPVFVVADEFVQKLKSYLPSASTSRAKLLRRETHLKAVAVDKDGDESTRVSFHAFVDPGALAKRTHLLTRAQEAYLLSGHRCLMSL